MDTTQRADHDTSSDSQERAWAAAHELFAHRAVIEQTKGMLMFIYGLDADEAFDLLRFQSQQHNIKLRVIAEQIRKDLVELASKGSTRRRAVEPLILTAHRRVADVAARQRDGQSKTGVPMKDLTRRPGQPGADKSSNGTSDE